MKDKKTKMIQQAAMGVIITGVLLIISFFIVMAQLSANGQSIGDLKGFIKMLAYMDLFAAIAMIALGSVLYKKTKAKPIMLVLLILFILYTFVGIYNLTLGQGWLSFVIVVGTLVMLIMGLVMKDPAPVEANPMQDKQMKIELYEKMRNEGKITEEEYKDLLLKELEK